MVERALSYVPTRIRNAIEKYTKKDDVCEIRLRTELPLSLTMSFGNIFIDEKGVPCNLENGIHTSKSEVYSCVNMLCEGSAYRHIKTMNKGFIMTDDGLRAGLSGNFLFKERDEFQRANNESIPLTSFSGVNIRIPRCIKGSSDGLMRFFSSHALASTLIFSPPGHGKTTLIRDFSLRLSRGEHTLNRGVLSPAKVCVIDSRNEIFPEKSPFLKNGGLIEVIGGCSKAEGIEIAARVMSPEIIVCDEIGSEDDFDAMLSAHSGGVILIATCHGDNIASLMRKPVIAKLINAGLFSYGASLSAHKAYPFKTSVSIKAITQEF